MGMGNPRLTRRAAIGAGSAAGLTLWLPDAARQALAATSSRQKIAAAGDFDGVMSGDPTDRAATFWTRLTNDIAGNQKVRLIIAKDEAFSQIVLRQDVPSTAIRDHTVKARVGGLKPDTRYWYRFHTKSSHSDAGRTQTAPPPDSNRMIRMAYFSCQAYTAGYYGAYRKLIELDPDFVLCGGDYIYEQTYHADGYDHARPDKTGANKDGFARTINDYREKYRYYRSDPDLREMHRLYPLVAQWDDHEVTDNYSLKEGVPPGDSPASAYEYDKARVLAGWRAWHEYMPALRPGGRKGPDTYRTYRKLRYGRNVDLLLLDQRSYRDVQPGSAAEYDRPRKYLGPEQMAWLKGNLAASSARWRIIGNQLPIMPLELAGQSLNGDSWQGYPREREELLHHIGDRLIKDVVFVAGDIHCFFAGDVLREGSSGPAVATEIVGGSTTSPGIGESLPIPEGQIVADQFPLLMPWLEYANTSEHGFAMLEASEIGLGTEFYISRDLLTRTGSADVRKAISFGVSPGIPHVNRI